VSDLALTIEGVAQYRPTPNPNKTNNFRES
jgi:hypothetical protein